MGQNAFSKSGTPPIGHAGRSYRSIFSSLNFFPIVPLDGRSGLQAKNEAVKSHAKASEEKERRAVLRHEWKHGSRQRNLKGSGVAGSEIVNDASQKHVKEATANLVLAVRAGAAGQLHLRNRFTAKGALR
jgi:hypothetical protein